MPKIDGNNAAGRIGSQVTPWGGSQNRGAQYLDKR